MELWRRGVEVVFLFLQDVMARYVVVSYYLGETDIKKPGTNPG